MDEAAAMNEAAASGRSIESRDYERVRSLLADVRLPVAFVELDALDRNVDRIAGIARSAGRRLRIATKSVRSVALLERIAARAGAVVIGLMTYDARETAFLAERGFRDLLLAYPTSQREDVDLLASLARRDLAVSVVVDDVAHLDALEAAAARAATKSSVVIDLDVSYRPLADHVHIGVRRSSLRTAADVVAFAARITRCPHLELAGVMAYEAQIAGVPDRGGSVLGDFAKGALKRLSRGDVERTRASVVEALRAEGKTLRIFNGGGSGSLASSSADETLTEVTAGSGFLCSHLFDGYRDLGLAPAAFFALRIERVPSPRVLTCHGGGYVASGAAGTDRLPVPVLPRGLALLGLEGAGEVQTPVRFVAKGAETRLAVGDPVVFRHAKAGELSEHFDEYLLVRGSRVARIEGHAKTYRGDGQCFIG
jgi:D-serine deaminase-like pyridoxal phosphate-dependent protein